MIKNLKNSVFLFVVFFVLSCGGGKGGLEADLEAIESLIKNKDCQGLYQYLSSEKKAQITQEEFINRCSKGEGDIKRLSKHIDEAKKEKEKEKKKKKKKKKKKVEIDYRAVLTLKDGSSVVLVYEKGGWKIDSALIDFYPHATPKEAISSFIKAFEEKRWDVLARLMPSKYTAEDDAKILEKHWSSETVRAEMEQVLMVLKDHLQDEIKIDGNRAELNFAPQHKIELLKERGVWVIMHIY